MKTDAEELHELRRWKHSLEKSAKVFRLEDAIKCAEEPSELLRQLRAFEIAAFWRMRAMKAELALRGDR